MQRLYPGDRGSAAAEVRSILAGLGLLNNTNPDTTSILDDSADRAIRAFQQTRGLTIDGIVGTETFRALYSARWRLGDRVLVHNATSMVRGDDVETLQNHLLRFGYDAGRADGYFGPLTENALRNFQRDRGLVADGVCAGQTLRAIEQLGRMVEGGRPQLLREMAAIADAGPKLLGKRVVVDPSHGGSDRGAVYGDLVEANLVWDLAARLEGRLSAQGITTWLTRGPNNSSTDEQRAQFANNQRADLVISLHLDTASSPRANGVATYYYGSTNSESALGERLADLVQREIVARTSMLNARIHPKTWELLRLTRMPTVQIEAGYLSSPADRARIADPLFRDVVAEAILVAVQRLYLPKEEDPITGVMRLSAAAS